jgi:hypothetical protein
MNQVDKRERKNIKQIEDIKEKADTSKKDKVAERKGYWRCPLLPLLFLN